MKELLLALADNPISIFIINAIFTYLSIKLIIYGRWLHFNCHQDNDWLLIPGSVCAAIVVIFTIFQFTSLGHIESAFLGIFIGIFLIFYDSVIKHIYGSRFHKHIKIVAIIGIIILPILLWIYYAWWSAILASALLYLVLLHLEYRKRRQPNPKHENSYDDEIWLREHLQDEYDRSREIWPDD